MNRIAEKFVEILRSEKDDYFKRYLTDVKKVLDEKDDGGFEEPIKYYLAAKVIENFDSNHYIYYFGNTPKEEKIKALLGNNIKPDILIATKDLKFVFIIELKSIVKNSYIHSFILASNGEKNNYNLRKGDFWNQLRRLRKAPESISTACYILCFYLESIDEKKNDWSDIFHDLKRKGYIRIDEKDKKLVEDNENSILYYLIEILDDQPRFFRTDVSTELSGLPFHIWIPFEQNLLYSIEINTDKNNYFISLDNLEWDSSLVDISQEDKNKIIRWIHFYRNEIEEHWNNKIDSKEFLEKIEKRKFIE